MGILKGTGFDPKELEQIVGAGKNLSELTPEEKRLREENQERRENSALYSHVVRALLRKFLGLERENKVTEQLFKSESFIKFVDILVADIARQLEITDADAHKALELWLIENNDFTVLVTGLINKKLTLPEGVIVNIGENTIALLDQVFIDIEAITKRVT